MSFLRLTGVVLTVCIAGCRAQPGATAPKPAPPSSASASPVNSPTQAGVGSAAPVIREDFDPLPCDNSGTTLGDEGCAERDILRQDAAVDAFVAVAWNKADAAGRAKLQAAEEAWSAYRKAECDRQSDIYRGGTEQAVVQALCTAQLTKEHLADLKATSPP
jgi:uncharacterized protein YecT (DUF1311 family)